MSSIQPRKQRKAMYNAPLHLRRKHIASHLSEELLLKYNVRRTPLVSGDEVNVLRGDHKGKTGVVVDIDTKARKVVVEGVTHKKADGTDVAYPLDASNLRIIKLNLEDKRRRAKLGEAEAPAKPAKKATKPAAEKAPAKETEPAAKAAAKPAAEKAPAKETKPAAKAAAKPAAEKAPATETKEASE
jgi:large subunit ribosomal protein L24